MDSQFVSTHLTCLSPPCATFRHFCGRNPQGFRNVVSVSWRRRQVFQAFVRRCRAFVRGSREAPRGRNPVTLDAADRSWNFALDHVDLNESHSLTLRDLHSGKVLEVSPGGAPHSQWRRYRVSHETRFELRRCECSNRCAGNRYGFLAGVGKRHLQLHIFGNKMIEISYMHTTKVSMYEILCVCFSNGFVLPKQCRSFLPGKYCRLWGSQFLLRGLTCLRN